MKEMLKILLEADVIIIDEMSMVDIFFDARIVVSGGIGNEIDFSR